MSEGRFTSVEQTGRHLSEPGHRYQPRRYNARPVQDAPKLAVVAKSAVIPVQPSAQPKLVDPFVPNVRKSKTARILKPAIPRQHRSKVLKRQFVDRAAQHTKQNQSQHRLQLKAFAYGGLVTFLILGGFVAISKLTTPTAHVQADAKVATLGVSTDNKMPSDETPITTLAMNNYKVSATQPRNIRIPKLQITARVLAVDANIKGEPLTPTNIFDAGWLRTTTNPGEVGAALLVGASAGPTKAGVFANLFNLTVGDEVQVERGDGSIHKFRVVKSQNYPADSVDMAAVTKSAVAGRPGLNLLTVSGKFNVKSNQFEPRTVIFTVEN